MRTRRAFNCRFQHCRSAFIRAIRGKCFLLRRKLVLTDFPENWFNARGWGGGVSLVDRRNGRLRVEWIRPPR
jgi:hypothetical protein